MGKWNKLCIVAGVALVLPVAFGVGSPAERLGGNQPAELLLANFSCTATTPPDPGFVIAAFRYAATGGVTDAVLQANNRFFDDDPTGTCASLTEAMHDLVSQTECTTAQVVDLSAGDGTLLTFEFSCMARRNGIVRIMGVLSGGLLEATSGSVQGF